MREVNLLGQNVNAYRGPMHDGSIADLGLLIHAIAEIDGIGRIRFTTSHPLEFSDSLIDAYANVPQLANYLHLPVQSGSDRILAAMKRGYTALEFKQKLRKLRAVRPGISICSDFIVGFPGETDADFEQTMKLIDDVGFDQSFSFIYSARPGTPAANLEDETPRQRKTRTPRTPAGNAQRERPEDQRSDARQRAARAGRRPERTRCERVDRQDREHARFVLGFWGWPRGVFRPLRATRPFAVGAPASLPASRVFLFPPSSFGLVAFGLGEGGGGVATLAIASCRHTDD